MANNSSINKQIQETIEYLLNIESGNPPNDIYKLVIEAVEKPLIESILKHTKGNQTIAAKLLGISRITLRKKIKALEVNSN